MKPTHPIDNVRMTPSSGTRYWKTRNAITRKRTLRETVTHLFVRARIASWGLGGHANSGEKTTGAVWFQVSFFPEDVLGGLVTV
jgi:hypothetical protein